MAEWGCPDRTQDCHSLVLAMWSARVLRAKQMGGWVPLSSFQPPCGCLPDASNGNTLATDPGHLSPEAHSLGLCQLPTAQPHHPTKCTHVHICTCAHMHTQMHAACALPVWKLQCISNWPGATPASRWEQVVRWTLGAHLSMRQEGRRLAPGTATLASRAEAQCSLPPRRSLSASTCRHLCWRRGSYCLTQSLWSVAWGLPKLPCHQQIPEYPLTESIGISLLIAPFLWLKYGLPFYFHICLLSVLPHLSPI